MLLPEVQLRLLQLYWLQIHRQQFQGSSFTGCTFDYATFERTLIENEILDTCCPAFENLKSRFARTLRTNYQSLGDTDSVNKAILVELDATRIHLWKSWGSNESYYRQKYTGTRRFRSFLGWVKFSVLEYLWGNGERPWRLFRTAAFILVGIAVVDTLAYRNPLLVVDYFSALVDSPQILLGTKDGKFPGLIVAGIAAARLIIFGLFLSILVRRFARR